MIRRPPRSTPLYSSAASDVYKRQNRYCEILFPWMEKCYAYCVEKKLIKDYNIRLPCFMMERFVSFWFSKNIRKRQLSYARLGNFMLSNNINKFMNPTKIPFAFRMYPTFHDY